MKTYRASDMAEAWHLFCDLVKDCPKLVPNKKGGWNFRGDYYIHLYDIHVKIKSCSCPGLYLEDMGYSSNGSKATHLMSRYLSPPAVNKWLDYIVERMTETPEVRGELPLRTQDHKTKTPMAGACIRDFMFRIAPKPTLIVITRSMEVPTKALGDVFLVSALARALCNRLGIENVEVSWYLASIWTRSRTANYLVVYNWPRKVLWGNKDMQEHMEFNFRRYYLSNYEFTYNANVRAKELFKKKRAGTLERTLDSEKFYQKLEDFLR